MDSKSFDRLTRFEAGIHPTISRSHGIIAEAILASEIPVIRIIIAKLVHTTKLRFAQQTKRVEIASFIDKTDGKRTLRITQT